MTVMTIRQKIGQRIRARRDSLGLGQKELAAAMGCSRETISNYERGERPVVAEDIARFAEVLDCTAAYFYGEDSEDDIQEDDVIRYYRGAPPHIKDTVRLLLKRDFERDDAEETTHSRKAE